MIGIRRVRLQSVGNTNERTPARPLVHVLNPAGSLIIRGVRPALSAGQTTSTRLPEYLQHILSKSPFSTGVPADIRQPHPSGCR
ncbi:hypothetical protein [Indiicoccus explosivorum]|uniref:hypothetical protein n=1 Tax=Indiicoccus explosivorum TaxID=1917864 RepID=UPI000B44B780|nr:hypothetical protein [Indiicoccus explosivorum]